ncbi:formylmethanofuran--tetrahydromethanopterin N-formyltransferase [Anatilimnocola floriformis]|uniref:formylmethanofuran--tetrahydromethanopterin N-formyltransferase n=1 Tax=Anatilimnocola floriformis TaxID=2948575 RepID=UPI0020C34D7F|nr:formylmethanofuran--tetrahydromethanopterin N-formyltransferase [Anatilimnocola floriformis]
MPAIIDDTYAEAFRSIYAEFLITARDRRWVEHAVNAATGNASSTILCDCEAGVDRYVGPGSGGDESFVTPDGRPGAIVQLHVPRFRKDRLTALERVALVRISQNVLTCPTTACFNLIDSPEYFKLGRKIAFFGDGFQKRIVRHGRKMWWIPILGGEFILDRRFGFADGLMGGNIWYFGETVDAAVAAAEAGVAAVANCPGVIMPFPGGIAGSGSKAGSKYKFMFASTYEKYCPELVNDPAANSQLPPGVKSVMEIIINGRDLQSIINATQAAITASVNTPGLLRISAGNYNGRLGKSFIYLHPDKQPAVS